MSDLQLKTWESGKAGNLRTDSVWEDDRYNPTKYTHPHRFDNQNFPEQEYKDIFGGTLGQAEEKEKRYYQAGMFSRSKAEIEFQEKARSQSAGRATNGNSE